MSTAVTASTGARAAHLGPERRRPQVLDAAMAIALTDGIAAVSFGAIAQRLGVSRPVVYACFPDRVGLLQALLEREEAALIEDALGALPHGRRNATEADFVDGFQSLLAAVSAKLDAWRLVLVSDPDPAVAEHFRRARRTMATAVEHTIRPTLTEWGVDDLEQKLPVLVEFFLSTCEGAVRSLLNEGSAWTPAQLGEFIGLAVYRAMRQA
ncbi:TetR/AcrR family transcriptional regulator [Nocardioides speluncae]|uniref:TetR/AcrR family transcriptional regulator n=1 Tax=Nocardioides speluncae TaxID=2670337 RepID=UPI000D69AD71|nr:TetR/AcrR family transcriptional regulator [Nocardioides speluncae]